MAAKKSKNLLWKIHQWIGLYVGIVIAALSLTGAVAVFIPEIDAFLERKYEVTEIGDTYTPMNKVISQVQLDNPDFRILGAMPPAKASDPLILDIFFEADAKDSERIQVFINPYTGAILGQKSHTNSLSNYLRQIHVRLMDGWWGRQIVGLAGVGLFILCITGLLIYGQFMKNQLFGAIRQKNLRILMADWHKMVGMAALLFNLMIAGTGAWLGLQPILIKAFDIKAPNTFLRAAKISSPETDINQEYDYWMAIEVAKSQIPQFTPTQVIPSKNGTNTIEIKGDVSHLPFEPHISKVVLDKTSLEVLDVYDIRQQEFSDKFYYMQEGLHFGRFGGIFLKIAYALLAITSGVLSITGFFIYLIRKKKTAEEKDQVKKTIFIYSISTIALIIGLALISVFIGYAYATMLVTPAVYIFLLAFISYQLFRFWKKEKSTKETIHEKA
ncbi:PepSY-associated TM helix domain-containing protein [Algoriphagus antarcticus]|uniref:Putative iron-regulated membrane protein n=1 Tax=Algoriphagus antarcticus TaxID=238540 RepID=A0A3E0DWU3_9BACT|nr:PepSY-associated TM helix domain-containing protein [Algoriphagus antarcticus]REG90567.1 putative iron-regulated membrane protein [Algoriphagus antarcticus]